MEIYVAWLNSNRFATDFHEISAFGTTLPRKKIKSISSASEETLSELMVNVADAVPAMVVEAAEILFATMLPTYTLRQ